MTRFLVIVAFLLFVLPLILANFLHLYSAAVVGDVSRQISTELGPEADPLTGQFDVVNARDQGSNFLTHGYSAFANHRKFDDERLVRLRIIVPARELLSTGETMPSGDDLEIFAMARASSYAAAECERIKSVFASACKVATVTGKSQKDTTDISISATLQFVANEEVGPALPKGAVYFRVFHRDLFERASEARFSIADLKFNRMSIYNQALKGCRKLRQLEGNCAITSIGIEEYAKRDGGKKAYVRARLLFGYLQPANGS